MIPSYLDVISRLLLAAVLGGVVGFERESLNRPAGLRTHVLVCVGSALIMMVSLDVFAMFRSSGAADPGRIAAQVVSGIGFLGAGTILRDGSSVRGLTTAASLWVIAGIGLAVGSGYLIPAVATAGIVMIVLVVLSRVERQYMPGKRTQTLHLLISDRPGQLGRIGTLLGEQGINIRSLAMDAANEGGLLKVEFQISMPKGVEAEMITELLSDLDGVHNIRYTRGN